MSKAFTHDAEEVREKCARLIASGVTPSWERLGAATGIKPGTLRHLFKQKYGIGVAAEISTLDGARPPRDVMPEYSNPADANKQTKRKDGAATEYTSWDISGQIRSEADMIRACKIDLRDKIIAPGTEHRKWDVTLKLRKMDDDGKQYEVMRVVPQFYVRLRTLPRHPQPIEPVLQPLELSVKFRKPRPVARSGVKRALILADAQTGFRRRLHTTELVPFHDRRVLDIALQILQLEPMDNVSLVGDCLDMSEWSMKFLQEPEFYWTTQPALIEWAWWLAQYREAAPNAEMDLYEGNHEARPEDMLLTHMKAAYGLRPVDELALPAVMTIERLLALHALHVNYIKGYPDNKKWLNRNVLIRHGDVVRANPGDTAKAVVTKTTYTTVFGHVHRRELVSRRIAGREGDVIQTAFCPGCACHIDGRVPGSASDAQWQQGLAVIEYTDDFESIVPIPIENGRAIYRGRVLEARDRTDEVETMIARQLKEIH